MTAPVEETEIEWLCIYV